MGSGVVTSVVVFECFSSKTEVLYGGSGGRAAEDGLCGFNLDQTLLTAQGAVEIRRLLDGRGWSPAPGAAHPQQQQHRVYGSAVGVALRTPFSSIVLFEFPTPVVDYHGSVPREFSFSQKIVSDLATVLRLKKAQTIRAAPLRDCPWARLTRSAWECDSFKCVVVASGGSAAETKRALTNLRDLSRFAVERTAAADAADPASSAPPQQQQGQQTTSDQGGIDAEALAIIDSLSVQLSEMQNLIASKRASLQGEANV